MVTGRETVQHQRNWKVQNCPSQLSACIFAPAPLRRQSLGVWIPPHKKDHIFDRISSKRVSDPVCNTLKSRKPPSRNAQIIAINDVMICRASCYIDQPRNVKELTVCDSPSVNSAITKKLRPPMKSVILSCSH